MATKQIYLTRRQRQEMMMGMVLAPFPRRDCDGRNCSVETSNLYVECFASQKTTRGTSLGEPRLHRARVWGDSSAAGETAILPGCMSCSCSALLFSTGVLEDDRARTNAAGTNHTASSASQGVWGLASI